MTQKYLLYIDVLGFRNLVKEKDWQKIEELYSMIDSLNVHEHYAFKAIVFSDTILVYNPVNPVTEHDHEYIVMYACEFVQDLTYRLTNKNIHFRAILTFGEFKHYNLPNIECYYGNALVESYDWEKEINGIGLFIDRRMANLNKIFPTANYNQDLDFVFLFQCFERLNKDTKGELPIRDLFMFEQTMDHSTIKLELNTLKNIYENGLTHPDPKVREKHLQTYQLHKNRYQTLLSTFEFKGFKPEVIHEKYTFGESD